MGNTRTFIKTEIVNLGENRNKMKSIKIILIDDHPIFADGLKALLSTNDSIEVMAIQNNGLTICDHPLLSDCDLIIMDMNMGAKDGIEVLKELRNANFEGQVIFLSSYSDLRLVNEAIKLGANGYVTKSSASQYLELGIQEVMSGNLYYSPDIKEKILSAFTTQSSGTQEDEEAMLRQLTERELEVLKLIAQQYTSDEIGKKLFIARSTVDTHRKNLIYKLKVKNAVGLGLFAEKNGLI